MGSVDIVLFLLRCGSDILAIVLIVLMGIGKLDWSWRLALLPKIAAASVHLLIRFIQIRAAVRASRLSPHVIRSLWDFHERW